MPKIWCFCFFVFFWRGQSSVGVRRAQCRYNPRVTLVSFCCLLLPLCPFFPYSICCHDHPHGTRQFTSSVTPVCCHYVKTSLRFWLRLLWETATYKTKADRKKQTKKITSFRYLFLLWTFAFCFFLPLRTVTSFVFHSSYTRFEHHLYVALYLCNSCSCDYDGLWI